MPTHLHLYVGCPTTLVKPDDGKDVPLLVHCRPHDATVTVFSAAVRGNGTPQNLNAERSPGELYNWAALLPDPGAGNPVLVYVTAVSANHDFNASSTHLIVCKSEPDPGPAAAPPQARGILAGPSLTVANPPSLSQSSGSPTPVPRNLFVYGYVDPNTSVVSCWVKKGITSLAGIEVDPPSPPYDWEFSFNLDSSAEYQLFVKAVSGSDTTTVSGYIKTP